MIVKNRIQVTIEIELNEDEADLLISILATGHYVGQPKNMEAFREALRSEINQNLKQ